MNAGGTPGNKGGGRPPNIFRDALRKIRENPSALQALTDAATDPKSRNFGHAWKTVTDYDEEKPAQKQEIVGPIEVRVRIVKEG